MTDRARAGTDRRGGIANPSNPAACGSGAKAARPDPLLVFGYHVPYQSPEAAASVGGGGHASAAVPEQLRISFRRLDELRTGASAGSATPRRAGHPVRRGPGSS